MAADVGTPGRQAALAGTIPGVNSLVTNNGGPPVRDFRQVVRAALPLIRPKDFDVTEADFDLGWKNAEVPLTDQAFVELARRPSPPPRRPGLATVPSPGGRRTRRPCVPEPSGTRATGRSSCRPARPVTRWGPTST